MAWFVGFVTFTITGILKSFIKRFGYRTVLFALQKGVQIIVIAVLTSAATWAIAYILQIWNLMVDIINHSNLSVGSASAFGITLATIWTNAKGFIYASGLSTALVTVGNLYISIISLIFIKALYAIYIKVVAFLYHLFDSGINLLATSS